jgi:hypothetical protein
MDGDGPFSRGVLSGRAAQKADEAPIMMTVGFA